MAEDEGHRVDAGEVAKQVLAALKASDAKDVSEALIRENVIAREQRRKAEEELAAVKEQLPAKDAVVLAGDDAKRWDALKGLELAPDKIAEAITERDELKAKVAERERADARIKAAQAEALDPDRLALLDGLAGREFETREVGEGKDKRRRGFVKRDDGKVVPLAEYLAERFPEPIVAALAAEKPTPGTPYPRQRGSEMEPGKAQTPEERKAELRKQPEYTI